MAGVDFFSLPMDARPGRDPIIGYDEAGNPLYRGLLGNSYTVKPQAAPDPQRAIAGQMVQGLLGNPFYGPSQAEMDVQRQGAEATLGGILPGLLQGVLQGVKAPGRAARGEPVTYGDAWATALDYGALAAPAGKPAGAIGGGGIRAYHGSPHDFDRFDLSKIGTGEGAQAYGHGLYFAENEAVARAYRDLKPITDPTDGGFIVARAAFDDAKGNVKKALAFLDRREQTIKDAAKFIQDGGAKELGEIARARELVANDFKKGRMYEVNINADPADFLDWDAPLSQQSPKVRAAAASLGLDNGTTRFSWNGANGSIAAQGGDGTVLKFAVFKEKNGKILAKVKGRDLGAFSTIEAARAAAEKELAGETIEPRGATLYGQLGGRPDMFQDGNGAAASQAFKDAGIPGIKYLDAGSRGAGDGSRNFVVFDDRLIEIVRKYGIAGAAAMLGISAAELQAQMGGASAAPSADDLRGYLLNVGAN